MIKSFKHRIIKGLTPEVKLIRPGCQLQRFRSFRNDKGWMYEIEFFPGPRKGVWLYRGQEFSDLSLDVPTREQRLFLKPQWNPKPDPVQLYVRAHLLNRRLVEEPSVFHTEESVVLRFEFEGGGTLEFLQKGTQAIFDVNVKDEGKSPFVRHVQMMSIDLSSESGSGQDSQVVAREDYKQRGKDKRLIQKIQQDIDESRRGLKQFDLICAHLRSYPASWGDEVAWPEDLLDGLQSLNSEGTLPAFKVENRSEAQDKLFGLRRRFVRKVQGAEKRMHDVLAQVADAEAISESEKVGEAAETPSGKVSNGVPNRQKVSEVKAISQSKNSRKAQSPGLRLEHPSGIVALVGKKQSENAELLRKANSRDVWFHVRGIGGAHVWIPRGQKGLSSKQDLPLEVVTWAAQLALYNSKARTSRYGMVDMAEKRYLKSLKGQPGHVIVTRSEVITTELDDGFDAWLRSS